MSKKILIFVYIGLSFLAIEHLFTNRYSISTKAEVIFENHTIINKFSLLIPLGWTAKTQSDTDDFFLLTNYAMEDKDAISTNSIKTEVIFLTEPLDVILENHFRAIKYSKEDIIRQGEIIIDSHRAKRIWYQGDSTTFPNTISSYIPYNNEQTVIIHSYYHPENPLAVDTIERVHWSFKNLE